MGKSFGGFQASASIDGIGKKRKAAAAVDVRWLTGLGFHGISEFFVFMFYFLFFWFFVITGIEWLVDVEEKRNFIYLFNKKSDCQSGTFCLT